MKTTDLFSHIQKEYARPNRFSVTISPPTGLEIPDRLRTLKSISLNCSNAALPGKSIATREVSPGGHPIRKMPHSFQHEDLSCSFYLSEDLTEKKLFDSWQKMIVEEDFQNLGYYSDYIGQITIEKLDLKDNPIGVYDFHEAYPLAVSSATLDYSAKDQIMTLPVTFSYRHWTYRDTN